MTLFAVLKNGGVGVGITRLFLALRSLSEMDLPRVVVRLSDISFLLLPL